MISFEIWTAAMHKPPNRESIFDILKDISLKIDYFAILGATSSCINGFKLPAQPQNPVFKPSRLLAHPVISPPVS